MIYFLINHDFHFENIRPYIAGLEAFSLIQVPYSLHKNYRVFSDRIITVHSPYAAKKTFWNPLRFLIAKRQADRIIFRAGDIIVFQTEADPINLRMIRNAHIQGARVLFLEEGMGSYTANMPQPCPALTFRNRVKMLYLKYLLGFPYISFSNPGGYLTMKIADNNIDAAMFYIDADFDRNIKKYVIKSPVEVMTGLEPDVCIFLNQPIYDTHYLSFEEFMAGMQAVLKQLSAQFGKCVFRFHPRDSKKATQALSQIIGQYDNIIIDGNTDMEQALSQYKPLYVASLFSSGVIKLAMHGLVPLFLYPLIEKLAAHATMKNIDDLLAALHYHPVTDENDLKAGARALRLGGQYTLLDVLNSFQEKSNASD